MLNLLKVKGIATLIQRPGFTPVEKEATRNWIAAIKKTLRFGVSEGFYLGLIPVKLREKYNLFAIYSGQDFKKDIYLLKCHSRRRPAVKASQIDIGGDVQND